LAGVSAAGKWTGIQNGIGNLAGIAAQVITGFIVERTGRFLGSIRATKTKTCGMRFLLDLS